MMNEKEENAIRETLKSIPIEGLYRVISGQSPAAICGRLGVLQMSADCLTPEGVSDFVVMLAINQSAFDELVEPVLRAAFGKPKRGT